VASMPM